MKWLIFLCAGALLFGCESQPGNGDSPEPVVPADTPKPTEGDTVREMRAAGAFYPMDAGLLRKAVDNYIGDAGKKEIPGLPVALVSPHAGYVYSGHVSGHAYAAVKGMSYDTVVVLGSHTPGEGVSILDLDWYRTPLGYVEVDREIVNRLLEINYYDYEPGRHKEHAIENQVPFLQVALEPGFKIVALAVNDNCAAFCHKISHDLAHALEGRKVLLVASTDLSHYPPYDKAVEIDGKIMDAWKELDGHFIVKREESLMKEYAGTPGLACVMCGKAAVAVAVETAKQIGADSVGLLKYANSGDIAGGDKNEVVGYGAAVIYEKGAKPQKTGELSGEAQNYLLEAARKAVTAAVNGKKVPEFKAATEELKSKLGVFVTLYKNGKLRGCIGCFDSEDPLPQTVAGYAVLSATRDTRFKPVTPEELDDLDIKISVLSEPRKIGSVEEIEVGKHGIWIRDPKTGRSGTYLPEVATEMGWDRDQFLASCCRDKAGLPADCWKKDEVDIYTYTTQVFGEK